MMSVCDLRQQKFTVLFLLHLFAHKQYEGLGGAGGGSFSVVTSLLFALHLLVNWPSSAGRSTVKQALTTISARRESRPSALPLMSVCVQFRRRWVAEQAHLSFP